MAEQALYAEEAQKALKEAIEELEEMNSTFNTLNTNVDASINAETGKDFSGQVGGVAANVWNEDNVAVFHQLVEATRDFNENKVDPALRNFNTLSQDAESTYKS